MPQGPLSLVEQPVQGTKNALNITAATVVKATPGRVAVCNVSGTVTGNAFAIYDAATTGSTASSNLVYQSITAPAIGTQITLDFPCLTGIVVVPSNSALAVAISYT